MFFARRVAVPCPSIRKEHGWMGTALSCANERQGICRHLTVPLRLAMSDGPVVLQGKQRFKVFEVRVMSSCLPVKVPVVETDEGKGRGKQNEDEHHRHNAIAPQKRR